MAIAQIQIRSLDHLLLKRHQIVTNNSLPVGLPDAAAYYFCKEASFLSKKQERWSFYLFQGLNVNPQNLSIYLRDEAARQNKGGKEKLGKGVFMIWDMFNRVDIVIEINIPGNLRIYKLVNGKKQLVSNEQMDQMYLSSAFRTMYQTNLPWGRSYLLFHDSKNYLEELKSFLTILFRSLLKKDVTVAGQFQSGAKVKGSHGCSLVFNYLKERKLVRQAIEIIEQLFAKNKEYKNCFKYGVLLSQLYVEFGKPSKSIQIIFRLLEQHSKDSYLLYYQSRYLLQSGLYQQALTVCNGIVQYNQLEIWLLLGQIHLQLKNYGQLLICLNHAVKMSKIKGCKNTDVLFKSFQQLGKIKANSSAEGIQRNPKLMFYTDNPLNILVKEVEEKNKSLIERGYWRLNANEKIIYQMVQDVRYRLESRKFEELLMSTFEDTVTKYQSVYIKKGIYEASNEPSQPKLMSQQSRRVHEEDEQSEDLPDFLKNSFDKVQEESVIQKPSRLSIIPQIESVIENSNYEEKEKQKSIKSVRVKRQVNEGLFRIVQLILAQTEFQKAEYDNDIAKILPVYNKMRTSSKFNNYYQELMFKIFMDTGNYKSVIVLLAQILDFLEQRGIRKMDKLPYWMHKYLFVIIEEKGLKYLNEMLEKMNFYDEAIIDTIELAKNWKMKGITY